MIPERDFIEAIGLTILEGSRAGELNIVSSDINRPGLPLSGYLSYFSYQRPQVFGKVEMSYLKSLPEELRRVRLEKFFNYDIPCVIVCHDMDCVEGLVYFARKKGVPVYITKEPTTDVVLKLITYLNNVLAPRTTQHGVLVDVFGTGILITGESGVGKSETALELVKRGHRLVADDVVDIRRVSNDQLVGEAPEMVRHFMEIRGIGIIDIATMYGIGSVIRSKSIDLVVHFEIWKEGFAYDRLGLEEPLTEILDVKIPRLLIPIRPGRNLAVVLEVAARNQRLNKMGFNAAKELDNRLRERLGRSMEDY